MRITAVPRWSAGARSRLASATTVALLATTSPAHTSEPPVSLALVLDTSGSLRAPAIQKRQLLTEQIAEALPVDSEIAVFAFDDVPRLVLSWSTDRAAVVAASAELGTSGQFTALYDALFDASRYVAGAPGRQKAILLITDGLDENSAITLEDGVDETRDLGIAVFTLGIGRVQPRDLRRISKLTGGRYFGPNTDGTEVANRILEVPAAKPRRAAVVVAPVAPARAPALAVAPTGGPAPTDNRLLLIALVFGTAMLAGVFVIGYVAMRARRGDDRRGDDFDAPPEIETLAMIGDADHGDTIVLALRPLLHAVRGPDAGRLFELKLTSATNVGRGDQNDIVLEDRAVSTEHCRIRPVAEERRAGQRGTFEVIDLKSTNGTWINERRVSRRPLAAGDIVRVGETQLQLRMDHTKS